MTEEQPPTPRRRKSLRSDRRSSVTFIFAILVIPLCLALALAVGYGCFFQAPGQLNLVTDAALLCHNLLDW